MKQLLLILITCLTMCGCSRAKTASVTITPRQYETDFSAVDAEEILLSGMKNSEFQEELNNKLSGELSSSLVSFDTLAQENSDKVTMGNKSIYNNRWSEKYNKNDFISLVNEEYIYLGGAHGTTARRPLNADAASGCILSLGDLFADSGYKETLNRLINELIAENPDAYADLWEKPEIMDCHQTDFYINDTDLVIFFQPYTLSYYARGFVEFPIKLENLSGYMKEEYRRLLPNNPNQPKATRPPKDETPANTITYTINV